MGKRGSGILDKKKQRGRKYNVKGKENDGGRESTESVKERSKRGNWLKNS